MSGFCQCREFDHAVDKPIHPALDGLPLVDGRLVEDPGLQHGLRKRLAVVLRLKIVDRLDPVDLLRGVASFRQKLPHREMVVPHQSPVVKSSS